MGSEDVILLHFYCCLFGACPTTLCDYVCLKVSICSPHLLSPPNPPPSVAPIGMHCHTQPLTVFLSLFLHGQEAMCATTLVWRSEATMQESVLSFHHAGSKNQTQVIRLGGKHLSLPVLLVIFNLSISLFALLVWLFM